MQFSNLWGQTKYLPHGDVLGCRHSALQATLNCHRHLCQLCLKYKPRPSTTCEVKLQAQTVASSKHQQTLRSRQQSKPGFQGAHQCTWHGEIEPTRYNRCPNDAAPKQSMVPNRLRRLTKLTAHSNVHSAVPKTSTSTGLKIQIHLRGVIFTLGAPTGLSTSIKDTEFTYVATVALGHQRDPANLRKNLYFVYRAPARSL